MTALRVTAVTSQMVARLPAVAGQQLAVGSAIKIDPNEVGSGSGGAMFHVIDVDGRPSSGMLLKRHDGGPGIKPNQNAHVLTALHAAINAAPDVANSERLVAVPFWVGEVEWGGKKQVVSLAVDLVHLGYVPLDDAFEGPNLRAWVQRPLEDRVLLAIDAAEELAACDRVGLVHADINPENLFVNHTTGQCALIDFDSGWVPGAPGDRPLVWGKPDGFVAPEVRSGGRIEPSLIGTLTERWATGILMHHLLFGRSPFFFLNEGSDVAIAAYLRRFAWPDVDQYSDLINQQNRSYYNWYVQELAELPPVAVEKFRTFAEDGSLRPTERPGPIEWADALRSAIGPPEFVSVTVSTPYCAAGKAVTVTWDAPGATEVRVEGEAGLPATGQLDVVLTASGPIHLLAVNAHGTVGRVVGPVKVICWPAATAKQVQMPRVVGVSVPRPVLSIPKLRVPSLRPRTKTTSVHTPSPPDESSPNETRSGSGRLKIGIRSVTSLMQAIHFPRLWVRHRTKG